MVGGRGGGVGVGVGGGAGVGFGVEEPRGGGGPAQCPQVGPALGRGDVRGLVLFGQLFRGEEVEEVVEAVAVGGGVRLKQSCFGEFLCAPGCLSQRQAGQQCGALGAEVGAGSERGPAEESARGPGQLPVGQGEGGPDLQ